MIVQAISSIATFIWKTYGFIFSVIVVIGLLFVGVGLSKIFRDTIFKLFYSPFRFFKTRLTVLLLATCAIGSLPVSIVLLNHPTIYDKDCWISILLAVTLLAFSLYEIPSYHCKQQGLYIGFGRSERELASNSFQEISRMKSFDATLKNLLVKYPELFQWVYFFVFLTLSIIFYLLSMIVPIRFNFIFLPLPILIALIIYSYRMLVSLNITLLQRSHRHSLVSYAINDLKQNLIVKDLVSIEELLGKPFFKRECAYYPTGGDYQMNYLGGIYGVREEKGEYNFLQYLYRPNKYEFALCSLQLIFKDKQLIDCDVIY